MDSRRALGGLFVLLFGVCGAFACSDSEPADVPTYGSPNGLKAPPLGPNGTSSSSGGSSGGSSGSSSGGGTSDGGGPVVTFACETAGGTLLPASTTCAVSWTNTIYPAMQAGGAWGCATAGSCHGSPAIVPNMTATTPSTFYAALANFTTVKNLPYFNPCSTDPNQSTFVCNTSSTANCGTGVMPLAGGTGAMTDAGLAEIATWVACGAPQN